MVWKSVPLTALIEIVLILYNKKLKQVFFLLNFYLEVCYNVSNDITKTPMLNTLLHWVLCGFPSVHIYLAVEV